MTNIGCISWLSKRQPFTATIRRMAWGIAAAVLATGTAFAQDPAAALPAPGQPISVPDGYTIHESVDLGGRMANVTGSNAMYDTMVNMQTGPRVLGETFELHGLAGKNHPILDDLKAFSTGLGGDPYNYSKLDFSKGKLYEFSGTFRRDRQYFDYDLLGNPGIPGGFSIPIGPSTAPTGSLPWSQVNQSPFLFNTVRRMTDTNLTLLPLSKVTFRAGYSQNIFQGPSMTPSGYQIGGSYSVLLEQYQRNSTDDFTGGVDWKPVQGTKLTFEEQIDHYKGDSYFTLAPQDYVVQESDGTKVALLANYYGPAPYGYNTLGNFVPYGTGKSGTATATSGACNASIAVATTMLHANPAGGLPIIDPGCNVISSYSRYQPTRVLFPTEIFRLQSTSIKNISMNGDVRYTNANMNLPNYNETFQGLQGANRTLFGSANASAKREVMAADYGIIWQATKTVSLADQMDFSNVHQPGTAVETGGSTVTVPTTAETINNTNLTSTLVTTGNAPSMPTEGGPGIGAPQAGYFGQRFATNNFTVSWDATPRSTFSLTYRFQDHLISEGQGTAAHNVEIPANNTTSGEVKIRENGGIFNAALRPATNWEINGSVEAMFNDNVFTPMGFRQSWHYRVHTMYRPKSWATLSGAFNDLERHNNTNNQTSFPGNTTAYFGPLNHVDHSRVASLGAQLYPNDHYGLDLDYSYSDVYLSVNACFQGAATFMPGGAVAPGASTQSAVMCGAASGTHGLAVLYLGRDFEDQPTQYGSASVMYSPVKQIRSNLGYRVNSTNGSRFFSDAADVNGTLVSTYQTPFANVAYTMHKNLVWKGEYNYFGYGEGGPSGAQYCNANAALVSGATSAPSVLCSSVANTAMSAGSPAYGFTAPRNFHASNVTLGVHYEF